jgi:hypothetical protein
MAVRRPRALCPSTSGTCTGWPVAISARRATEDADNDRSHVGGCLPDAPVVAGYRQYLFHIALHADEDVFAVQQFPVVAGDRKPEGDSLVRIPDVERNEGEGVIVLAREEEQSLTLVAVVIIVEVVLPGAQLGMCTAQLEQFPDEGDDLSADRVVEVVPADGS